MTQQIVWTALLVLIPCYFVIVNTKAEDVPVWLKAMLLTFGGVSLLTVFVGLLVIIWA